MIGIPKVKGGGPERPISIFPLEQRVLCRAVLDVIWVPIEVHIRPHVSYCTFRKGGVHPPRGVAEAAIRLRDARLQSATYVFESDIQGFFDKINREKLIAILQGVLPDDTLVPILRAIVFAETAVDMRTMKGIAFDSEGGVPQGAAISPLLACAYLQSFDAAMDDNGFDMIRYVDDFVVLLDNEALFGPVESKIRDVLGELKLTMKVGKTFRRMPDEEIEFLGHRISSSNRLMPRQKRWDEVARKIAVEVNRVPEDGSVQVGKALASYLTGFFRSTAHCDWDSHSYREVALMVKRAAKSRRVGDRTLIAETGKGKKLPPGFLEELRKL